MDRRRVLLTSLAGVLAWPLGVEAQQAGKVYRIGVILTLAAGENEHLVKALDREISYLNGGLLRDSKNGSRLSPRSSSGSRSTSS